MEYVIPIFGGLALVFVVAYLLGLSGGSELQQQFKGLGNLKGRAKADIIQVVGNPNAVSGAPEGKTLLQWITPGYHIALLFDGEICEGITHEVAV